MKFRSEVTFGSGERDFTNVCAYETYELENTDIIDYLCEHILKSELKDTLKEISDMIDWLSLQETYSYDDICDLFKEVLKEINQLTGKDYKYCLWLADIDGVKSYDLHNEVSPDNIDCYEESAIFVSDIGFDGKLYLYEEIPEPICTYEEYLNKLESKQDNDIEVEL